MKKSPEPTTVPDFEPEFVAGLTRIFDEMIPFNRVLGVKITSLKADGVKGRIDMRPELIGHFVSNRLHGGVISAGLDAMAGVAVMAAIGARHMGEPPVERPPPLAISAMETTKLSSKGQVILPRSVRDAHNWPPGTEFAVEAAGDGVLL